ncbi:hypothetical protein CRV15_13195 [Streptomyces clavuligerus]|uniref:Uncharacterized protein n=1 Tax=Streptomyces clavuligerus TaxID=1901 RepID=B5GT94_STRCL|nr:hypothetical protein D1794_13760 [Streptomyces clavuligerus]EDY49540.1 hypothetical protein SSCG_02568 [Streptomyces clavuligerus]EFG08136.1 Hypothetical protein SCLAV_3065 [Streptomyces clavuligerus]QCS06490.1 hypothetical protein CRV15_13195 [Streptomyces clavuligerus]QPJ94156.1 hypothetical protein GE265_14800 [Streptomyces clavuligerus]
MQVKRVQEKNECTLWGAARRERLGIAGALCPACVRLGGCHMHSHVRRQCCGDENEGERSGGGSADGRPAERPCLTR